MSEVREISLDFYDVPPELDRIFDRDAQRLDRFMLRTLYRGLRGEPCVADDVQSAVEIEIVLGIKNETIVRLAPIYNAALIEFAHKFADPEPARPEGEIRFAKRAMQPYSLDKAIEAAVGNTVHRLIVKRLFRVLRGKALPSGEDADELRRRLQLSHESYARACSHYELALAHHQSSSKWRTYDHGRRRRRQQHKMALVLPRAFALRLPVIANNQFHEAIHGKDIWGQIDCSEPLRPGSVGIIAYVLGVASHPDRFSRYGQIDSEGRVLTSKTRLYQTLAAIDQASEPGGGGQKMIDEYLAQLERLEITAGVDDKRGIRGGDRVPEMVIAGSPFPTIEKCIDGDDGELEWVSVTDPRPYSRRVQFPLRFTIANQLRSRIGVKGEPGDRVYYDPHVWRFLSPLGRAMYLEVRGRAAKRDDESRYSYVQWGATNKWALRFGLDHLRDDHREKVILAGLQDLYRVDSRIKGYAKPWHFYTNSKAKHYRVYVDGRSALRPEFAPALRRADLLLQLLESDRGGKWPGRLSLSAPSNAPPDTS